MIKAIGHTDDGKVFMVFGINLPDYPYAEMTVTLSPESAKQASEALIHATEFIENKRTLQ